ncbi:MAG: hypothetical protein DBX94_05855 [Coriobacteriia bacterium]|nr:MAG: hypothetical protein DBX94_05855 [Coriobacteriia bacterium]
MNNKPAEVAYGCTSGAADEGGLINDKLIEGVEGYAADHGVPLDLDEVKDGLKDNPLLTSQMEALNAPFELVWRLGTLNFTDGSLTRSSERKGGQRFQKAIRFSSNLDLIGILEETDPDGFARVLLNWLVGDRVSCAEGIESRLTRMLAVFSEPALFKTCKGDSGTVFTISGIYGCLLEGDDDASVDLVEGKEAQGPTRILKTAVEAGLYPALDIAGHTVTAAKDVSKAELEAYASRIRVSSQLANVKLDNPERNTMENRATAEPLDEPRNLIYFGAPGTGKSHELGEHADRYFDDDHRCRVTFYPDYTYSQFVGCFKPMTEQVVDSDGNKRTAITYRYALGPFLETYVKAVKNPEQNYLLIVEEINRANPAAVFGDVFQLLDRRSDGCSEYTVAAPEDMREQLMVEFDNDAIAASKLAIPSNMYIWATMNSADQGVFPMDTAFKRRWDFRYMGINEGEDADIDGTPLNKIEVPCGGRTVVWNNLRHAINDFMASDDLKINEDKLLGPFFINPNALTPERFADVFKDKVLLYLYEDAGKTKRKKMFKGELNTYAKVCEAFDESGEGIFGNGFDDHIVYDDDADDVAPEE